MGGPPGKLTKLMVKLVSLIGHKALAESITAILKTKGPVIEIFAGKESCLVQLLPKNGFGYSKL